MITITRQGRVGGGRGGASTLIRQGEMITITRQGRVGGGGGGIYLDKAGGDDYHNKAGAGWEGRGGIYLDKAGGDDYHNKAGAGGRGRGASTLIRQGVMITIIRQGRVGGGGIYLNKAKAVYHVRAGGGGIVVVVVYLDEACLHLLHVALFLRQQPFLQRIQLRTLHNK